MKNMQRATTLGRYDVKGFDDYPIPVWTELCRDLGLRADEQESVTLYSIDFEPVVHSLKGRIERLVTRTIAMETRIAEMSRQIQEKNAALEAYRRLQFGGI